MQRTFRCEICQEKLVLVGTPQGIQNAFTEWAKGHAHGTLTQTQMVSERVESGAPPLALDQPQPRLFEDGAPGAE